MMRSKIFENNKVGINLILTYFIFSSFPLLLILALYFYSCTGVWPRPNLYTPDYFSNLIIYKSVSWVLIFGFVSYGISFFLSIIFRSIDKKFPIFFIWCNLILAPLAFIIISKFILNDFINWYLD